MPRKATSECNLQVHNAFLASEWHPTKNGELTPLDVFPNSHKKVWWLCKNGHEWMATLIGRNKAKGQCRKCAVRNIHESNKLTSRFPEIALQWHPKKNSLPPNKISCGSSKKAWWVCKNGHDWEATVANRTRNKSGCPYCAGQRAHGQNSLEFLNPALAAEWHPTKNGSLTTKDVLPNTHRNAWWRCDKEHEWQQRVDARNNADGCPYCAQSRPTPEYCLQEIYPDLAKEWHPTKNEALTPRDVMPSTHKKVWWLCKKGHEWRVAIDQRSGKGAGCPRCFSQTSFPELLIYTEMKYLYKNVEHRKKHAGVECDVYIPAIKVAIEVDGKYWHKDKVNLDMKKTNTLRAAGVFVIRVREKGLPKITDCGIGFNAGKVGFGVVQDLVKLIFQQIEKDEEQRIKLNTYLDNGVLANQQELAMLMDMLPSPLAGDSLQEKNPLLSSEWHPKKNKTLTPKDVYPDSGSKVWWLCSKGHEWKASLTNRNKGNGCPFCSGRIAGISNNLMVLNPKLAAEWHPTKNEALTPNDVLPGSSIKAWWVCKCRGRSERRQFGRRWGRYQTELSTRSPNNIWRINRAFKFERASRFYSQIRQ